MEMGLSALVGTSALGVAGRSYLRSRRALRDAARK